MTSWGSDVATPEFLWTQALVDALGAVEAARLDLFVNSDADGNEITLEDLDAYTELVRTADRELVKTREAARNQEFYPYYPESYGAEQDALNDVAALLEGPLPTVPEGVEIDSVSR